MVSLALRVWALGCSSSTRPAAEAGLDGGHEALSDALLSDQGSLDTRTDRDTTRDGGPPVLTMLRVSEAPTGDASTSPSLVPHFSPSVHDYYVRCTSPENSLTVSMTASPGAKSLLSQPIATASSPKQTVTLTVNENQAIVALATDGSSSTEYWVRCLPPNFPLMQWTEHDEAGARTAGYYLLGSALGAPSAGYAMILDVNGVPVWYKGVEAGAGVYNVDDIVDGAVSFKPFPSHDPWEINHLDPLLTTYLEPAYARSGMSSAPVFANEHELRLLRNQNFLIFSYPVKVGVDLSGMKVPLSDGGVEVLGSSEKIQDCQVVEFEPAGKVVWSWLATDHFDPVKDSTYPQLAPPDPSLADGGSTYDVFHCNSIDVDAQENLLVSARHMDSVFYVERPSGRVLWKMGGATYTDPKDDATYVPVMDPFYRQHDARFQSGWTSSCGMGSGPVSVFDDETEEPGPARAVIYDVDVHTAADEGGLAGDCGAPDAAGSGHGQATRTWQYKGALTSTSLGSFRFAADGSRMIGWGAPADTGSLTKLTFSEVDSAGHDMLDFYFLDGNISYRAFKVPVSNFDLGTLRKTAGLP
jgi:hypothetical protein